MKLATSVGCESIGTWLEGMWIVWACIRSATVFSSSGPRVIPRFRNHSSTVGVSDQEHGTVFQGQRTLDCGYIISERSKRKMDRGDVKTRSYVRQVRQNHSIHILVSFGPFGIVNVVSLGNARNIHEEADRGLR